MVVFKRNVVILTGAGISAESGLKTFRGEDGLWEGYPVEQVASIDGYYENPELVQQFYNLRRRQLKSPNVKPNLAHEALVKLEREWTGDFLLVTQNVDDLHDRAGSKNLVHMHGELAKVRCQQTEKVRPWSEDVFTDTVCPDCTKKECLRPHIVWFGEMPLEMDRIYGALEGADLFISIGTSGLVYPAAGFVSMVKVSGKAKTVELNLEPTTISGYFDEQIAGRASDIVPQFVDGLLKGKH